MCSPATNPFDSYLLSFYFSFCHLPPNLVFFTSLPTQLISLDNQLQKMQIILLFLFFVNMSFNGSFSEIYALTYIHSLWVPVLFFPPNSSLRISLLNLEKTYKNEILKKFPWFRLNIRAENIISVFCKMIWFSAGTRSSKYCLRVITINGFL